MSGAGSTFGGFMAGLPQDVKDLTEGSRSSNAFSHNVTFTRSKRLVSRIQQVNRQFHSKEECNNNSLYTGVHVHENRIS